MDIRNLTGSVVALVTPFSADGSVDFDSLGRLIDFHLANKTDAILVLGTTGESATMTHEEDDEVCRFTVERVAGRVPVIAGSGSNSTQTMVEKSLSFQALGVDGLLLISPYYNKANEEGMYLHFAAVADAVDIPCILYNVPGRTGCSIPESVVARLAKHPNIMGIKEASGNIGYAARVARLLSDDFVMFCGNDSIPESVVARLAKHPNIMGIKEASGNIGYAARVARLLSDDFVMFCGNDDMVVPYMALGARGVISVWANVMPEQVHEMCAAFEDGRIDEARAIQLAGLDVVAGLFAEVNPIPVKAALEMMGMGEAHYRLPLCPMGDAAREKLAAAMKEAGLL